MSAIHHHLAMAAGTLAAAPLQRSAPMETSHGVSGSSVATALGGSTASSTASSSANTSASSSSSNSGDITANDFLTLLVSELQNQDPTQPTDPNAYITQMVGVNSLQQLISINQELS